MEDPTEGRSGPGPGSSSPRKAAPAPTATADAEGRSTAHLKALEDDVRTLLCGLGDDLEREGLRDTPRASNPQEERGELV